MTTVTDTAGPLAPPLSLEAYAHCFSTFRKHSTEWLAMLRWTQERLLPRPADKIALRGPERGRRQRRL